MTRKELMSIKGKRLQELKNRCFNCKFNHFHIYEIDGQFAFMVGDEWSELYDDLLSCKREVVRRIMYYTDKMSNVWSKDEIIHNATANYLQDKKQQEEKDMDIKLIEGYLNEDKVNVKLGLNKLSIKSKRLAEENDLSVSEVFKLVDDVKIIEQDLLEYVTFLRVKNDISLK